MDIAEICISHCLSHTDLYRLLWRQCSSYKAELDEELPLLGEDSLHIDWLVIDIQWHFCLSHALTCIFLPSVQWQSCTLIFGLAEHLVEHLVKDHTNPNLQAVKCRWRRCSSFFATQHLIRQVMGWCHFIFYWRLKWRSAHELSNVFFRL